MRFEHLARAFGQAIGEALAENGKFRFDTFRFDGEDAEDWQTLEEIRLTVAAPTALKVALGRQDVVRVREGDKLEIEVEGGSEAEAALRGPGYSGFLRSLYGNRPARWSDDLAGHDRLRIIINAMTRMRLVAADGTMEFSHKLGLASAPAGYVPWFDAPRRASRDTPVIFGHWAALGLVVREDVVCLDSGCVWGRRLTALRLEDRRLFECDCAELPEKAVE